MKADLIITAVDGFYIFTPVSSKAESHFDHEWQDHPGVGNYGVVRDHRVAARLAADFRRLKIAILQIGS